MPDCDGAELARRVTADPRLQSTQLIVRHASSQHGEQEMFIELASWAIY